MNLIELINLTNKDIMANVGDEEKMDSVVSELMMHKILFITYGMFYKQYNRELFKPKFVAWQYGPVEINYRKEKDNAFFLSNNFAITINEDEKKFLVDLITKLLWSSPWFLVEFTHQMPSWTNNYKEGSSIDIPSEQIQKDFKNVIL